MDAVNWLKRAMPNGVLIVIGSSDELSPLVTVAQAPIYRAFTKPISVKQLFLSIDPAISAYRGIASPQQAVVVDISAPKGSGRSVVFAVFGLAALGMAFWLSYEQLNSPTTNSYSEETTSNVIEASEQADGSQSTLLAPKKGVQSLINMGRQALDDGRLLLPNNDNAFDYLSAALKQDPFNNEAYQARKALANALMTAYPKAMAQGELELALDYLDAYRQIVPLDPETPSHVDRVRQLIAHKNRSKSATSNSELTLAAPKPQMSSRADSTQSDALIQQVQTLITQNRLVPTGDGANRSAYDLLTNSNRSAVNDEQFEALLRTFENALASDIEQQLNAAKSTVELNTAKSSINYLTTLSPSAEVLTYLDALLQDKEKTIANQTSVALDNANVITPARLLRQTQPRYPTRALERNQEGWVDLRYKIDLEGRPFDIVVNDSQPAKVFDRAAIRAIRNWRFLPATNTKTGQPIVAESQSTRITFQIDPTER